MRHAVESHIQKDQFDLRFRALHERSMAAARSMPSELLFKEPGQVGTGSFGTYLLRSAGSVEQAFGGITVRLWDDPFEWTLPEELSTNTKIVEYLLEVEATRIRGFGSFATDADLAKKIPAPETLTSLFDILLGTLARAEHFQGRAFAISRLLTGPSPELQ